LRPQLAVGLAIKDTRGRANAPFLDPDHNFGVAPDVLDPRGTFTCFRKQIETVMLYHKPNFDFARKTSPTTHCC
jgi:hypothetical protein